MCSVPFFYQISGYRAHSHKWFTHKKYDDKPVAEAIISTKSKLFRPGGQDSPTELVLGILPSGASYLLMSNEQMLDFTHKHRQELPRDPWKACDFLSLSPIYFDSLAQLNAKIATYKQRPRNKNRREHEEILDNSQANRGYVKTGTSVVHYRAYFEQQRTLYRLLTRELEPSKVGLASPPWLNGVRVVSLVIGEWSSDKDTRMNRLENTQLVDAGWTDTSFPSFFETLTGSTVHVNMDKGLKNPSKDPYFSDVVKEKLNFEGLYMRLRSLFNYDMKENDNENGSPLIVLVHDEEMVRRVLSRGGIDVASWSSGLSEFLPLVSIKDRCKSEDTSTPAVFPKTTMVDMQKLVGAVMEINPGATIPQSAKVLKMQKDTRTCAGDDSLLQLRMWVSIAQGLAIDEQHKERAARPEPECVQVLAPPEQQQQQPANEEIDPNDMAPGPGPRPTIADDFSDDDDW